MGLILDELWDWVAIGVYRKYGWKGAAVVVLAPIAMVALIIWLIVVVAT